MARIYVASSWRNQYYPEVVERLRAAGHEVYDFRNPPHGGNGFRWTDIDENATNWAFEQYAEGLHHPKAERQFAADLEALEWADTCVLVLPCGRSAHTEAGWMSGKGKRVIVYIPEMQEPELMYKLFDLVVGNLEVLVQCIGSIEKKVQNHSTDPNFKVGLNAWVGNNPRILILGTLPGDTSIGERAFYDDNRNAFWKIIYYLLPLRPGEETKTRKEYITSRGIALWDCLASAVREGSTDAKIVRGTEKGNDIQGFLEAYPSIHTIILNGTGDTAKYFKMFCPIQKNVRVIPLPSTARSITDQEKIEAWSILKKLVGE